MPRYLVTTHREDRATAVSAQAAVAADPDVTLVSATDPQMVTIDATEDAANRLRDKLKDTHYVEPEIRRSLA